MTMTTTIMRITFNDNPTTKRYKESAKKGITGASLPEPANESLYACDSLLGIRKVHLPYQRTVSEQPKVLIALLLLLWRLMCRSCTSPGRLSSRRRSSRSDCRSGTTGWWHVSLSSPVVRSVESLVYSRQKRPSNNIILNRTNNSI